MALGLLMSPVGVFAPASGAEGDACSVVTLEDGINDCNGGKDVLPRTTG